MFLSTDLFLFCVKFDGGVFVFWKYMVERESGDDQW